MTDFPRQYAATRRFTLGSPRNLRVSPDGAMVYFLRSRDADDPVLCLWAFDVATGNERVVADPKAFDDHDDELPAAERARRERARESAGGIVAYTTDRAFERAAFVLGGTLSVVDLATDERTDLPSPGAVFDPVLDPTGSRVAFVGDDAPGLWVVDAGGRHEPNLIADDPDPLVSWGRAEFVAGEEMSRTRGFWWSPDGERLLAQRTDERQVVQWWINDPAHPERPPHSVRYPRAGTANASVDLALFTLDGSRVDDPIDIDWSDGGRFEYLADVVWSPGHDPVIVRQTRDQRTVEIVEVPDHGRGVPVTRRTITDPTWVELFPGSPTWSDRGLLTIEDTASARALHLDGNPLTDDSLYVRTILRSDGDSVWITASTDRPGETHVLEVALDDPSSRRIVSNGAGVHTAVSAGGTTVLSSLGMEHHGSEVTVRTASGRHRIADRSAKPVITPDPRFFAAGERSLNSAVFFPTGHDGSTPLPVLLDPYGGPHAQRVVHAHNPHLVSQWFADQGFAVLVTDGRGTPGRSPAFERTVWGDLAGPVLEDQIDALDAAAAEFGCLDLDAVGIRGWSFGGYLAALAVLRRPDRFHAAIAGAPVTDWALYDTHYTERYLGTPTDHPEHYDRCDLTVDAHRLERPLLLIHGLADDNVVAAHTLQLSTALLGAGRPHQVLPLSGVTHMTPQESVAENLLRLQRSFLVDQLCRPGTEI